MDLHTLNINKHLGEYQKKVLLSLSHIYSEFVIGKKETPLSSVVLIPTARPPKLRVRRST